MKISLFTAFLIFFTIGKTLFSQPEELGQVKWIRDLDQAIHLSKNDKKDILILFQEVPGCATCKNYGNEVLSNPLIVEAIETYFIPLCIYNNKKGKDETSLKKFNEPAWNNPVIRIIKEDLQDRVERINGPYNKWALWSAIETALVRKNIKVPKYIELLKDEEFAYQSGIGKTTLGMYCFWAGEKNFAKVPGIIKTEAGYMSGHEVVEVYYNLKLLDEKKIIDQAKQNSCADYIFSDKKTTSSIPVKNPANFSVDKETKYYLYHSIWSNIPMTPYQALKANEYISINKNPEEIFSPQQNKWYAEILSNKRKASKKYYNADINKAWQLMKPII